VGVIGIEPLFAPSYVPEATILDDLTDIDRLEGVSVTIQLSAFPEDMLESTDTAIDYDNIEVAYKRLVVSEAETPNLNPEIAAFTVDGTAVPPGAVVEVDQGQLYEIGIALPTESVETYSFTTSAGAIEERVEEPYVTWFTTGDSTLNEPYALYPYLDASWIAAREPGTGTWWAVVRDRRGGMAWYEQPFTIR
jgi:hypothetical protein